MAVPDKANTAFPPEQIGVVAVRFPKVGFGETTTVAVLLIVASQVPKLIWLNKMVVFVVTAFIDTVAFPDASKTTVWLAPVLIV